MEDILVSGRASFQIEVPYKLIETGKKEEKPLIIYLHGFNQNLKIAEEQFSLLKDLEAYHLYIQAPYPIYDRSRKKKLEDWGRAWYLYDGEADTFIESMEAASSFIQQILDRLTQNIDVNRVAVVGYSMGGYLAGYFAFTRWKHVIDVVVIGGRIKTEPFEDRFHHLKHLNILALHGKHDKRVEKSNQERSVEKLIDQGLNAEFRVIDGKHELTDTYIREAKHWLTDLGY